MQTQRDVRKVWKNGVTYIVSLPKDWVKNREQTTKRPLECVVMEYNDKEVQIRSYPENGESKQEEVKD